MTVRVRLFIHQGQCARTWSGCLLSAYQLTGGGVLAAAAGSGMCFGDGR